MTDFLPYISSFSLDEIMCQNNFIRISQKYKNVVSDLLVLSRWITRQNELALSRECSVDLLYTDNQFPSLHNKNIGWRIICKLVVLWNWTVSNTSVFSGKRNIYWITNTNLQHNTTKLFLIKTISVLFLRQHPQRKQTTWTVQMSAGATWSNNL